MKKMKRDYPDMGLFTEDGTDGLNSKPHSPVECDDGGGILTALLERPPPEPLSPATPLPTPKRGLASSKAASRTSTPAKTGPVREIIDIDSDNSGEVLTLIERDPKRQKVQSGPRVRREIVSPDLAAKNKGRGRYASSVLPER